LYWLYPAERDATTWNGERRAIVALSLALVIGGFALAIEVLRQHAGRDDVRLDAGAIRATWRLGPLSWSKVVRRSKVAQFTVVHRSWHQPLATEDVYDQAFMPLAKSRYADANKASANGYEYYALAAEDERGRRRTLVDNYPRDMLRSLAVELSSQWKALAIDPDLLDVGAGKLAVGEDTDIPTEIRERSRPPRGTRLILEHLANRGVQITMPPRGVASLHFGAPMLLGAGLLMWGILVIAPEIAGQNEVGFGVDRLNTWAGAAVRGVFGVVLIVAAARSAISGYVLTATPDLLNLETRGLRGTSLTTFRRDEIASICVATHVTRGHGSGGPEIFTRLLLRTTAVPTFPVVECADDRGLVLLLRKPRRAPRWAFAVVGTRTGPGTIVDASRITGGVYDYALQQKTPAGGLSLISPIVTMIVQPEEAILTETQAKKPELEWVATKLRRVLGVPATEGSGGEVI
jgi:hypothetical protein